MGKGWWERINGKKNRKLIKKIKVRGWNKKLWEFSHIKKLLGVQGKKDTLVWNWSERIFLFYNSFKLKSKEGLLKVFFWALNKN